MTSLQDALGGRARASTRRSARHRVGAERRGVRVPARLDHLHRGADLPLRHPQPAGCAGAMWVYFVLTAISTIYFGWHYLLDDVAGLAIGCIAVWIGAKTTGHRWRSTAPQARRATASSACSRPRRRSPCRQRRTTKPTTHARQRSCTTAGGVRRSARAGAEAHRRRRCQAIVRCASADGPTTTPATRTAPEQDTADGAGDGARALSTSTSPTASPPSRSTRPHNRNALSRQPASAELTDAPRGCRRDDDVRVVVLTHTGGTFCAGADLPRLSRSAWKKAPGRCWRCCGWSSVCRRRWSPSSADTSAPVVSDWSARAMWLW